MENTETVLLIPDEDILFLRIHKVNLDLTFEDEKKKIKPVAFNKKGDDGLSVDWSRYTTAEEAILRAKKPEDNGMVSLHVKLVRDIPLRVEHTPNHNHLSHAIILDIPPKMDSDLGERIRLRDICTWEIHYLRTE